MVIVRTSSFRLSLNLMSKVVPKKMSESAQQSLSELVQREFALQRVHLRFYGPRQPRKVRYLIFC